MQYPQDPDAIPALKDADGRPTQDTPNNGDDLLAQALLAWQTGDLLGSCRLALSAAAALSTGRPTPALPHALRQAALALCEFGLAAEALPLAQAAARYLEREGLHDTLSACLSCLGHVQARLGNLDQAELLHMRALSLARESTDSADRMRAYTNLLVSMTAAHEQALDRGDEEGRVMARLALRRAERQLGGARSLAQDGRLQEAHQGVLKLAVAHLLVLLHRLDDAEVLLNQLLAHWSHDGKTRYWRWSAQESMADLLNRRGRHGEAWHLLAGLLAEADLQSNVQLHGSVLRQALISLRGLEGNGAQEGIEERIAALELERQHWEQRCAQASTQVRAVLAQELQLLQPWLRTLLSAAP